jgi:hypothetical protein
MFKIALQVKMTDDGKLILRLPPVFKLLFLFFSVFILTSMIYFPIEDGARGTDFIPVLFLVMAVFVTLYEEKWIFDRDKKVIESRIGLMFYFSRVTADMKDLKNIKISEIKKPNRHTAKYHKMTLVYNNDIEKDLEIVYFRELDKLIKNGELIAGFCDVSLYK